MQKIQRVSAVLVAGLAASAFAGDELLLENDYGAMSTARIGSIYYNAATGDLVRSHGNNARDASTPIWINEQYDQCGFSEWYYYRVRDEATARNQIWLDWADIDNNTVVDCFTMLLVSTIPDPEEDGEPGLAVQLHFLDGIDPGTINSGLVPYLTWEIGFPGSASGLAAWLITVDFATGGTPENYFEVGDSDGVDDSGNGLNSGGLGADLDGDGKADFAYAYQFLHPVNGISGGGLVVPPEGVEPNSLGDEDARARFLNGDFNQFDGFYWFGGYSCAGGSGFNWAPWASLYLGLYGGGEEPCLPDINNNGQGDGILDFFDVQQFLAWFSAHDPRADLAPPTGTFDFFDVQVYLQLFSAGCP